MKKQMAKQFKVGIIGAGRIGKLHAESIAHSVPGVQIKAIVDVKVDHLKEWAAKLGIPLTTDRKQVMEDPEIDAIMICSSTDTHTAFIREAAKAKKAIFCEKPIGSDLKDIKETLDIVKKSGVKLMIGFNRRFDHNFRRARKAVTDGEVGNPHVIKITSRDPAPPPISYVKVSGGIFFDMAIHDFDMARYLAGEDVEEVFAKGAVLVDPEIGKAGDIDTAVVLLKYKSGAMGIIDNSRQAVYGYDQRVEIFGSKGCVTVDNDFPNTAKIFTGTTTSHDKMHYFFLERYTESYVNEMKDFFTVLADNKMLMPVTGEDGLKAVIIAMAAKKSLDEKRPVAISEIKA